MIRYLFGLLFPGWTGNRNRHKATEHKLARSEERLSLAKSIAHIGTWAIDDLTTGRVIMSKGLRALYGLPADVPTGYEDFLALVYPEDRGRVEAAVARAVESGGDFEVEYRLRRPDGETLWLLGRGDVVQDDQGAPIRVFGVAMDVSERKAAEREREDLELQLRRAHKLEAVGRLAGGVAHDFNNLLLGIRGYTELASRAVERETDPRPYLDQTSAAVDRATVLTRQLLAFSRKQVLRPERLDLNDVVAEMESMLRQLAGEGIELEAVSSSEDVFVEADRGQLEQVISNLGFNARDAMADGGRLTFEVSRVESGAGRPAGATPGACAVLAVSDTGCGMDAETVEQIFEPFFTTKENGTGLGLAMVHGVVTQSGGTLWVNSEPGKGTTFTIYLPLAQAAGLSPKPAQPATVVAASAGAGETILVVDDDSQVREVVARMLEIDGYRVLRAADGDEAALVVSASERPVDLLLVDLVMPGAGGREVAARLLKAQPEAAVLHMSGYTDDGVVRRGVLERRAAFIEKPFSAEELTQRVRAVLDEPSSVLPSAA
jgi:two-component system cell cycle sensor histidine kinase/response regulator CckA